MGLFKSRKKQNSLKEFWALKNVSFNVNEGESIGIIGRNGAGKSTLLKLLSQITEPTEGEIHLRGRVASLLEVGTGFHPELTGRENIYMNGAILGMRRAEIKRKFDEIVAFAETEQFLDTPVKRYSSGMYVRLAFAVAAHLEPELLLVDEVLAVGDTKFQKKCLGKMENVYTSGRTIFFVIHNMGSIRSLCKRCIWLDSGRIKMIGGTDEVVDAYLSEGENLDAQKLWDDMDAPTNNGVKLKSVRLLDNFGKPASNFKTSEPVYLETEFEVLEENGVIHTGYHVFRRGNFLFSAGDWQYLEEKGIKYKKGRYKTVCRIPPNLLNFGEHCVEAAIVVNYQNVILTGAIFFFRVFNDHPTEWLGEIRPKVDWKVKAIG
jgi:lipopolysaccharide transport system ATP-binding protein